MRRDLTGLSGHLCPQGLKEFKVHVLKPSLLEDPLQQYLSGTSGVGLCWEHLHQRVLLFDGPSSPARRICGVHALLAIDTAVSKGWIEKDSVLVPDAA